MKSWEPRPLPKPTPETERYWAAATRDTLLLSECEDCGLVYHYPRRLCPDCLSEDVSWMEASGSGTVYTYTAANNVDGWPEEDLPLITAFVELSEGPRVMTAIVDADPDAISIGSPVTVEFMPTEEDDIAVPVFTLTDG